MNSTGDVSASNLRVDEDWHLQGRIVPPSCNKLRQCLLYLQTKHTEWPVEHYHLAQITLPPEMGVEFQASLLCPPQEILVVPSFIVEEQTFDVEYLSMYKFVKPEDTIGFTTVNGLVFIIQNKGLSALFTKIEACNHCNPIAELLGIDFDVDLDELMLVTKGETNH